MTPVDLSGSRFLHPVRFFQILMGCFWQIEGPKMEHIDFVGDLVRYYPVALALWQFLHGPYWCSSQHEKKDTNCESSLYFLDKFLSSIYGFSFANGLSCFL